MDSLIKSLKLNEESKTHRDENIRGQIFLCIIILCVLKSVLEYYITNITNAIFGCSNKQRSGWDLPKQAVVDQ